MCTMIATQVRVAGSATKGEEWTKVDAAAAGYDHATRLWTEHAVRLDLFGSGETVAAVELDLDSARALRALLDDVIAQADASGV